MFKKELICLFACVVLGLVIGMALFTTLQIEVPLLFVTLYVTGSIYGIKVIFASIGRTLLRFGQLLLAGAFLAKLWCFTFAIGFLIGGIVIALLIGWLLGLIIVVKRLLNAYRADQAIRI